LVKNLIGTEPDPSGSPRCTEVVRGGWARPNGFVQSSAGAPAVLTIKGNSSVFCEICEVRGSDRQGETSRGKLGASTKVQTFGTRFWLNVLRRTKNNGTGEENTP
jgi:hypothetical protein